jgi:DNA processing protein
MFTLYENEISREERLCARWLCSVPWIGSATVYRLLAEYGSCTAIYHETESRREVLPAKTYHTLLTQKEKVRPEALEEQMERTGMRFLLPGDPDYPERLLNIPDPTFGLFLLGNLPPADRPSVAVIGARGCSAYGTEVAKELGSALGAAGISVISGMAVGVDGLAQMATVDAGGYSCAVLGSGADVCYPRSNRRLYEALRERGGILSTYGPGTPAVAGHFPPRNRIVSGLCDFLVVVEARQQSGTLITVDMALEQGREIYAVPGRITDRLSDGCNGLLGQGAQVYLSPEILIRELLEYTEGRIDDEKSRRRKSFSGRESANPYPKGTDLHVIFSALDFTPQTPEELAQRLEKSGTPLPTETIRLSLMSLLLEGTATQVSQNTFRKS